MSASNRAIPARKPAAPANSAPAKPAAAAFDWQDMGQGHGVQYCVSDGVLYLACPITPAAIAAAPPSDSGKTNTVGTTKGFVWFGQLVTGFALGVSLNVSAKKAR